eukprot:c15646_g1_i1.p1 GENE.c15646_g1_i1~~c15646_g1_i1.p1  ORF type:complete len:375 (-),score=166.20 c15646_g1_i1:22-1146(-)
MTQNDSEFVLYVNGKAWGLPGFTPQDIIPQAVCRFNGFAPQVRTGVDTEGSPTGQLPLLEFSQDTITPVGYPNILSLLRKHEKTIDVDSWLTQQQLIETDVFESFLDNELNLLLLYYFWYGKDNYQKAMTPLFGKFYGFPNGYLKAWIKHSQVVSVLSHLKLTNQQIVKEKVRKCFKLLSERLGTQSYFHGTKPSSLDAIVFGHIVIHLHSSVPNKLFQQILLKYPNLVQFCQNILKTYFADIILASPSLGNTPEFDATMIELSSEGIDEQEQEQLEEEEEKIQQEEVQEQQQQQSKRRIEDDDEEDEEQERKSKPIGDDDSFSSDDEGESKVIKKSKNISQKSLSSDEENGVSGDEAENKTISRKQSIIDDDD